MTRHAAMVIAAAALIAGSPALAAPAAPAAAPIFASKAPDLRPIAARMTHGVVSVKNVGTADAGPFKVTVECRSLSGGACAEPPQASPYDDPAFPNKLTIAVPALASGAVFNQRIDFWDQLKWRHGNYEFEVVADAAVAVAESNEANNADTATMTIP